MDFNIPRVLFIGSSGRSGSTLLDRLLGQQTGFVSVGELGQIWKRGLIENGLCGCSNRFKECEFWTAVFDHAFGGLKELDPNELVKLERSVHRTRFTPFLWSLNHRPKNYETRLHKYTNLLRKIYCSIQYVSGARVIVDSTKTPPHGLILRTMNDIDLWVLHLVRDSRAVAFSQQRKKKVHDIPGSNRLLPRFNPFRSSYHWTITNILIEMLASRFSKRSAFLRYEDLTANPEKAINQILSTLEEAYSDISHDSINIVDFKKAHTVAGNPMRLKTGKLHIKEDNEWKQAMRIRDYYLVTFLSFPYLWKYGYKI